jgi:hypothetical protein
MKILSVLKNKKQVLIHLFLGLNVISYSQVSPTQWRTNGNAATSNSALGTTNNFPLKIKTNNQERIRITGAGNVGIGTVIPTAKLHVSGSVVLDGLIKLPNTLLVDSQSVLFPTSGFAFISGNDLSLKRMNMNQFQKLILNLTYAPLPGGILNECQLAGGSVNGRWISGPYKLVTNCPDVKVGIGIVNPRSKLDVIGITSSDAISIGADPSSMANDIFRFRIRGFNPTNTAKILEVSNTATTLFSVNNQGYSELNGQLAIGSTNNATKLSIVAVANNTRLLELKRVNNVILTVDEVGLMNLKGRIELAGNMEITTSSNTPLIIKNSSMKILQLDNNGLLHARRIKVDTDTWADFVFEKNYKLMPLNELQSYINENKHLPNVPSENEVVENGVDLVEMNKILLQKVEELTLYLLQQQKEIDELKENVKQ